MTTKPSTVALPTSSPALLRLFSIIARRRLRHSFRAVRMQHPERLRNAPAGPLVVCLNHPAWWDPLVCIELSRRLLPGRIHRAPISALSLQRYGLFQRLGMFPVEQGTARGAAQFLRASQAVLQANGVLWITAEGHFTDPRTRPTRLMPGLGALLHRASKATVVPLAIEYTFWNQRLPEVLLAAGDPLQVAAAGEKSAEAWTAALETRLQAAQDELAAASLRRDPAAFTTLLEGSSGASGPYAWWQHLNARLRGQPFEPDHEAPPRVRL